MFYLLYYILCLQPYNIYDDHCAKIREVKLNLLYALHLYNDHCAKIRKVNLIFIFANYSHISEAILFVRYVLIRIPRKKLDKTPYELWKGYKHNLGCLKVWGCLGKIEIPDFQSSKIGPKIVDGIFIGYASNYI